MNESLPPSFDSLLIDDEQLSRAAVQRILTTELKQLLARKRDFLGFQTNHQVQFPEELIDFLSMNLLNLGDGFEEGYYKFNAKKFEQAVVRYYARIWNLTGDGLNPQSDYWGYVTPMGATEGNICGLWYAREYLLGNTCAGNPVAAAGAAVLRPVAFFSESSHYSLAKACNILQISTFSEAGPLLGACPLDGDHWPTGVPANADGSIDIASLDILVRFFVERGYPVILCFNLGTTFSGAFDDVAGALQRLAPVLNRNAGPRRHYWVHVDGALAANYMPFIEQGMAQGEFPVRPLPAFDFRHPEVMSIAASPYKWIGSPWPFGVFVMRGRLHIEMAAQMAYVGNRDGTVAGSRNGLSAVFLWERLSRLGKRGMIAMVKKNEALTQYAYDQLERLDKSGVLAQPLLLQPRIAFSTLLLFRAPGQDLVDRFTLSVNDCLVQGEAHTLCHLVILEHVTTASIDELVNALSAPDAFDQSQ